MLKFCGQCGLVRVITEWGYKNYRDGVIEIKFIRSRSSILYIYFIPWITLPSLPIWREVLMGSFILTESIFCKNIYIYSYKILQ